MGAIELPVIQAASGGRRRKLKLPIKNVLAITLAAVLLIQLYIIPTYLYKASPSALKLSEYHASRLNAGLARCAEINAPQVQYMKNDANRINPRHTSKKGQSKPVLLRNATLFDGEKIISGPVDITFENGVISAVTSASSKVVVNGEVSILDVHGGWVTPGLVDMHSHHTIEAWPALEASTDGNEVSELGATTPFVRSLDGIKPYDPATAIVAGGGITTSLILPGSANIIGGEAFPIKNFMQPGENAEEVVEDLLLEHGIDKKDRRRYLKMACGENPKRVYGHTRMGNAWLFRKQMRRGEVLMQKQDAWCLSAAAAREQEDVEAISSLSASSEDIFHSVESLELDSTVAMLKHNININVHCYEPEDFEDMLLHSHEFGFRVAAFHHALSAWKVPEMLKEKGENITIATFSDFGLYKKEAYESNLYAGKILAEHGIPVAYKSDHSEGELSAKFLMFQAATGHAFGLDEELALQSVTSVPAKSMGQDHRVGYLRPGYDADVVLWDSHPLAVGATPLQVFIDGRSTLDFAKSKETLGKKDISESFIPSKPAEHYAPGASTKAETCSQISKNDREIFITGIKTSFLDASVSVGSIDSEYKMILKNGKITCYGSDCVTSSKESTVIALKHGHVAPGLTAISSLGLSEIDTAEETADGVVDVKFEPSAPENVDFAKYGVHLEGRAFARARFGGVTRAISHPVVSGILSGVSTGIKTSGKKSILDGGVYQDDVALHFFVGQQAKASTETISMEISKLREALVTNSAKDNVYTKASNGSLPLVVHVQNKYDILQLLKMKKEIPDVNLVVFGGAGAPAVANEIAAAKVPVILAPFRASPDSWEKGIDDVLTGPPLTRSSADVLTEAGVFFGLAIGSEIGDARIQNLMIEASWAAKYAGLSKKQAVNLVSRNVEKILGLRVEEEKRDFVIYEGDPLEFGASVVLTIDGDDGEVVACWPEVQ